MTENNPDSFYKQCARAYVNGLLEGVTMPDELRDLPVDLRADIIVMMSNEEELWEILHEEILDLDSSLLLMDKRTMIQCLSVLMDDFPDIPTEIASKYSEKTNEYCRKNGKHEDSFRLIKYGLRLGSFFSDAGWLQESIKILKDALNVISMLDMDFKSIIIKLDCLQRLFHSQVAFCEFVDANETGAKANNFIKEYGEENVPKDLLAMCYNGLSILYFAKGACSFSYKWSIKSLKIIDPKTSDKVTIDVLRQAAKVCTVRREFSKAEILILKACKMARTHYGEHHQKYADTLLDYGFLMLKIYAFARSVDACTRAAKIKRDIYGIKSIAFALARVDLSYALYFIELDSRNFEGGAIDIIGDSIKTLEELLPVDHYLLLSPRCIKAMLLVEIAIDDNANLILNAAKKLAKSAMKIMNDASRVSNVLSSENFIQLGLLYQRMGKYDKVEKYLKRAIEIREERLEDYYFEVMRLFGHLACHYCIYMQKFHEAESLSLRSISMSLKLFGEGNSFLGLYYQDLCVVYENLNRQDELRQTQEKLEILRESDYKITFHDETEMDLSLKEVLEKFFAMCTTD